MPELEFLTFSHDPKLALHNEKFRRVIKSTAARATRSSLSQAVASNYELQSNAARNAAQKGGIHRLRFKTQHSSPTLNALTRRSSAPSPSGNHMPFWNTVLTPLKGDAWKLLHYYRYYFRPGSWAIDAKKDWFSFVIEDSAATHATLSFVSLNRDLEEGSDTSPWTLHHRTRAIQLIRVNITKAGAHLNDALMGAIALLAITDGLEGQTSASMAHVEALEKLIRLRGGHTKVQQNEPLLRLVAWAVLCLRPVIPHDTELSTLLHSVDFSPISHSDMSSVPFQSSFHESAYYVLDASAQHLLHLLNSLPRDYPNDDTPSLQRQNIGKLIYHIEQHIRSTSTEDSKSLAHVLNNATRLYIALILRQMPRRTSLVETRVLAVQKALDAVHNLTSKQYQSTQAFKIIVLWATTIRFFSLLSDQRTTKETSQLQRAMIESGTFQTDDLILNLQRITWIGRFCNNELQDFCNEIGRNTSSYEQLQ